MVPLDSASFLSIQLSMMAVLTCGDRGWSGDDVSIWGGTGEVGGRTKGRQGEAGGADGMKSILKMQRTTTNRPASRLERPVQQLAREEPRPTQRGVGNNARACPKRDQK